MYADASYSPGFLSEAPTGRLPIHWKPGRQISGLRLICGRVVGVWVIAVPAPERTPNSPTPEMVKLLKNNYRSSISSQENKILNNNNIMIITEE